MDKNTLWDLKDNVTDFIKDHRKTWVPYVVIFLFVGGVWVWWDNEPATETTVVQHRDDSDTPRPIEDSHSEKNETGGQLICATAAARRNRPLPDLFALSLPAVDTVQPSQASNNLSESSGKALPKEKQEAKEKVSQQPPAPPTLAGSICQGGEYLIILKNGQSTQLCRLGDSFAGWQVLYIDNMQVILGQGDAVVSLSI